MDISPVHQVWPKPSCKAPWKGKKTRQAEKEVRRQHYGRDRPWVCQVPEGSGEQSKMKETGCEIICSALMTLMVKGLMMMMMMRWSANIILRDTRVTGFLSNTHAFINFNMSWTTIRRELISCCCCCCWLFPRMPGFWENVQQFILHLHIFFF